MSRRKMLGLPERNDNGHIELSVKNPRLKPQEYISHLQKQGIIVDQRVHQLFTGKEILSTDDWVTVALVPTFGTKLQGRKYPDISGWVAVEYPEYRPASKYAMLAIRECLTQDILRGMGMHYVSHCLESAGQFQEMILGHAVDGSGHADILSLNQWFDGRVLGATAIPFIVQADK